VVEEVAVLVLKNRPLKMTLLHPKKILHHRRQKKSSEVVGAVTPYHLRA
jgi:hypothetical protein